MKKKFICLIAGIVIIGIAAGGYYFLNKQDKPIEDNINTTVEMEENIKDENVEQVDLKSDLDKKYPVEDGFLTTIQGGSTDEEVVKNNLLLKDSNISIEDRLEAKRVAENFVQTLASFEDGKNEKYKKIASRYVVDDLDDFIENLFLDISNDKIKRFEITELRSEECRNEDENDYLYFRVVVSRNMIDKYDQGFKAESECDLITLLKVDGKYKVINFKPD